MVDKTGHEHTTRRRLPGISAGQLVAAVLVALAVVFIAQNRERVHISFFSIDLSAPVWLLLTVMVVVGIVIGRFLRRRG